MAATSARSPVFLNLRGSEIKEFSSALQAEPSLALHLWGVRIFLFDESEWGMLVRILHAAVRTRSIDLCSRWRHDIFDTAVQMLSTDSSWTGWMELQSLHVASSWPSRPMSLVVTPVLTQYAPQLNHVTMPDVVVQRSTAPEEGAAMPAVHTLMTSIDWLEHNVLHAPWLDIRILQIMDRSRKTDSQLLFYRRAHEVFLRASASDSLTHLTSLTMTVWPSTDAHVVGMFQCLPRLQKLRMRCPTPETFESTMAATPKGLRTLILDAAVNHQHPQSHGTAALKSLKAIFSHGGLGCLRQLTFELSTAARPEAETLLVVLCRRKKIRLRFW
ncbi:hypothetical protein BKA62DRAFT_715222 [Auriculariales sp. MPI-PUGE-AT-0066]|nr:hypothetical protein BKA62DRAFT_715222 [Auriculariales sp. MPI-PUGE-AT-0066]